MTAADVIEVLDALDAVGVHAWVDGGWGIDALVGDETRGHADLDVALDADQLDIARRALEELGFRHDEASQPGLPARLVMRDGRGREVDFHPLVFDDAGDGWQRLSGSRLAWGLYPAEDMTATGVIRGRPVRCLSPQLQVRFRLGYEWRERDIHDARLLSEHFGVPAPPPLRLEDGLHAAWDGAAASPMAEITIATVAERPELVDPGWHATHDVLPEYNAHGDVLNAYWPRLTQERAEFQFHLVDDKGQILARARSIPIRWDARVEDLPDGIDGAIARGFDEGGANVLCALVIMVPRLLQGRGLSARAVEAMREIAEGHGLSALIAPVRPSWKDRYPLVPIEHYAWWRRADGWLFDPWMRVHERLGATVLKPEPRSLRITGTVAEWEEWTSMSFPESGSYWFPGGLTTLTVDREADCCTYWEPNVWMHHAV